MHLKKLREQCSYKGFCKMQVAMRSIMSTKRKRRKSQSYIYTCRFYNVPHALVPDIENSGLMDEKYTQSCLNDHLYKTATPLRRAMLSQPKSIAIQSLLYKTTTCLARPATSFFVPQMKNNCLKQPLQNFIQRRNG